MTDTTVETTAVAEEKVTPRLKTRYREEILPALQSEFEIPNVMPDFVASASPSGSSTRGERFAMQL